jgi:hypothetical protein
MKAIKCPECGSTNTEYGEYQLVAYRLTVLDDRAKSAADHMSILWDECTQDRLDGEIEAHFMCNDCFATVQCASQGAEDWKAVEINNDRVEV